MNQVNCPFSQVWLINFLIEQDVNEPPDLTEKIAMLQSVLRVDKNRAKEIVTKNPKANVQELIDLSLN